MMENILRELQQPEYLHVLLNPLPLYGLAIALFGLIAATYLASRAGQITALVLVFATAIAAWPVVYHGDRAYDRVLALADDPGQAWLKAHVHRADQFIFLYYALAALAVAAIFVPKKWPRTATPLVIATMLLSLVSLGAGTYIAHAGGKIRHREFRSAPPPQTSPEPR
jgi:disulfide bond formation protein DsbB